MRPRRDKYDDSNIDTCYESLRLAIIEQAVRDYKKALLADKRCDDLLAKRKIRELENFFRGEWFEQLSNLDGKMLVRKTRKMVLGD